MKQNTKCVHKGTILGGELPIGANSPILTSTSYRSSDSSYNIYPRFFNIPNQNAVIEKLCALENTEAGVLFSSGMAAVSTAFFALIKSGDHVIIQDDIYGGTHHFITAEFDKFKINYTFVTRDLGEIEKAIKKETKFIYIETPSNPLLCITDIKKVADIARKKNIISLIDNTFASPINQNPHDLGIDIIIHSCTKYFGGHSDITAGAVLANKNFAKKIRDCACNFGGSLDSQTCYLLERSLKTLHVRVERQCQNALAIAEFLDLHPKIEKVYYPGLTSHPDHELAKKQMRNFGAVESFELDEKEVTTEKFLKSLKLIFPALSLGGVESLVCVPAATSHQKMTREERLKVGITDGLIRLSAGIEDSSDLINDISGALDKS